MIRASFRTNAANRHRNRRRGFTFTETLIALVVLLVGLVALMQVFPPTLRANSEAALKAKAALLAQMKAEEIRRDDNQLGSLVQEIALRTTPSAPVPFAQDNRLAYCYSGRSILRPNDTIGSAEDDWGVARIIVRYNVDFRPDGKVLYELRFGR